LTHAPLDALRARARSVLARAYVPYTHAPEAAALLLSDGTWVPGVRVENAAYPLLIPALLAAYYTARCAGRADVLAAVQTRAFRADTPAVMTAALGRPFRLPAPDALLAEGHPLPAPSEPLHPFLAAPSPADDAEGVALAAAVARWAYVPASGFPVGCVAEAEDGRLVPGCNVEHEDWTRGLCAERVALATARSYGVTALRRLYLTCPRDPSGTPCGACRQVLAELAPGVPIVMGRGDAAPEVTTPERLLRCRATARPTPALGRGEDGGAKKDVRDGGHPSAPRPPIPSVLPALSTPSTLPHTRWTSPSPRPPSCSSSRSSSPAR
jgi:homotetrameric cytidine deaminase